MIFIRVAFADTDAMGVVHHANYYKYFEVARVNWLREKGLDYKIWQARGQNLPLLESQCRYRRPAYFDDLINIEVRPILEGIQLQFEYEIRNSENSELLATGMTKHVCVDLNMKVLPLPSDLLQLLNQKS